MQGRISKLRQIFDTDEIDAFYIMNPENRYYLSGFTGSTGALLLTREQSYLLTDFRYLSQAAGESPSYQIVEVAAETYGAVLLRILQEKKISRLGVEGDHLTYNQYVELSRVCTGIKLKPLIDRVEGIRILKDRSEIELIEKAVSIADYPQKARGHRGFQYNGSLAGANRAGPQHTHSPMGRLSTRFFRLEAVIFEAEVHSKTSLAFVPFPCRQGQVDAAKRTLEHSAETQAVDHCDQGLPILIGRAFHYFHPGIKGPGGFLHMFGHCNFLFHGGFPNGRIINIQGGIGPAGRW